MKTCSNKKCGKVYPNTKEHFFKSTQTKDGLAGCCKACHKSRQKKPSQTKKQQYNKTTYIHLDCVEPNMTFNQIAEAMGITEKEVIKIYSSALRKLKKYAYKIGFHTDLQKDLKPFRE